MAKDGGSDSFSNFTYAHWIHEQNLSVVLISFFWPQNSCPRLDILTKWWTNGEAMTIRFVVLPHIFIWIMASCQSDLDLRRHAFHSFIYYYYIVLMLETCWKFQFLDVFSRSAVISPSNFRRWVFCFWFNWHCLIMFWPASFAFTETVNLPFTMVVECLILPSNIFEHAIYIYIYICKCK